jgi:hypothetical protein
MRIVRACRFLRKSAVSAERGPWSGGCRSEALDAYGRPSSSPRETSKAASLGSARHGRHSNPIGRAASAAGAYPPSTAIEKGRNISFSHQGTPSHLGSGRDGLTRRVRQLAVPSARADRSQAPPSRTAKTNRDRTHCCRARAQIRPVTPKPRPETSAPKLPGQPSPPAPIQLPPKPALGADQITLAVHLSLGQAVPTSGGDDELNCDCIDILCGRPIQGCLRRSLPSPEDWRPEELFRPMLQ